MSLEPLLHRQYADQPALGPEGVASLPKKDKAQLRRNLIDASADWYTGLVLPEREYVGDRESGFIVCDVAGSILFMKLGGNPLLINGYPPIREVRILENGEVALLAPPSHRYLGYEVHPDIGDDDKTPSKVVVKAIRTITGNQQYDPTSHNTGHHYTGVATARYNIEADRDASYVRASKRFEAGNTVVPWSYDHVKEMYLRDGWFVIHNQFINSEGLNPGFDAILMSYHGHEYFTAGDKETFDEIELFLSDGKNERFLFRMGDYATSPDDASNFPLPIYSDQNPVSLIVKYPGGLEVEHRFVGNFGDYAELVLFTPGATEDLRMEDLNKNTNRDLDVWAENMKLFLALDMDTMTDSNGNLLYPHLTRVRSLFEQQVEVDRDVYLKRLAQIYTFCPSPSTSSFELRLRNIDGLQTMITLSEGESLDVTRMMRIRKQGAISKNGLFIALSNELVEAHNNSSQKPTR